MEQPDSNGGEKDEKRGRENGRGVEIGKENRGDEGQKGFLKIFFAS